MVILQNTDQVSPDQIIDAFEPFKNPSTIEGIIIGNDLDSLLSACLLKHKFGWDISGIYNLDRIWHTTEQPAFVEKMLQGKYLAVDLDIYHPSIFSIGHHIETMTLTDKIPGHLRSLNPNLIRGIYNGNFARKYPLGTIHLLAWILGETSNLNQESKEIVWLSDSSYINGQSHRFRANVTEWVTNFFRDPHYIQHIDEIDTELFETHIRSLMERIRATGVRVSKGQVASRHHKLRGGQCQFSDPITQSESLGKMLKFITDITGWARPRTPSSYLLVKGVRNTDTTGNTVSRGRLDQFLKDNRVFSYAIPNRGQINYTNGFPFI